ncbi:MAG: Allene oxide cyclase [Gaiellaceae bacterium]
MRTFLALVTLILIVSVGIALHAGTTVAGARPSGFTATIRVVEHNTTGVVTDTGAKGDSAGDILTYANGLYNAGNTRKVGSDNGYCVRTVVGETWECSWTAFLPGGLITVQGPFLDTRPSKVIITGGTGKYSRATGWMDLKARNDKGTEYDFVYHLQN